MFELLPHRFEWVLLECFSFLSKALLYPRYNRTWWKWWASRVRSFSRFCSCWYGMLDWCTWFRTNTSFQIPISMLILLFMCVENASWQGFSRQSECPLLLLWTLNRWIYSLEGNESVTCIAKPRVWFYTNLMCLWYFLSINRPFLIPKLDKM